MSMSTKIKKFVISEYELTNENRDEILKRNSIFLKNCDGLYTIYQLSDFVSSYLDAFNTNEKVFCLFVSENLSGGGKKDVAAYFYKSQKKHFINFITDVGVMFGYPGPAVVAGFQGNFLEILQDHFDSKLRYLYLLTIKGSKLDLGHPKKGMRVEKFDSPYIDLKKYASPSSERLARELRYQGRATDNRSKFSHRLLLSCSSFEVEQALQKHFEFHRERWPKGVFSDSQSAYYSYFRNLFIEKKESLQTILSTLIIDDEFAAIHFGFADVSRFYYFSPTINPKYAKYSPGQLLIQNILKENLKYGDEYFDFMNDAEPYKLKWTKLIAARYFYTLYSHKFLTYNFKKYSPRTLFRLFFKWQNLISVLLHPVATVRRYLRF